MRAIESKNLPPYEGEFYAWKVARRLGSNVPVIMSIKVPRHARRVYGSLDQNSEHKCRASEIEVLSIQTVDGTSLSRRVIARPTAIGGRVTRDSAIRYRVGAKIKPEMRFARNSQVCASGIHFFMRREQAIDYAKRNF